MSALPLWIKQINKNFDLNFDSVIEVSPLDEKINYNLTALTPRKIDNGNSIKYMKSYYQPYLNGTLKYFTSKTEVLVIKTFTDSFLVSGDEQVLELKKL